MMEWEKQQQQQVSETAQHVDGTSSVGVPGGGNGVPYVKVMTDEQLETLRKQIAIYASICEQLVEMHKNLTAQQDLAGIRLGNLYCDPSVTSAGHKITARQRWTPTAVQLQILERIFNQGNGTPSKQKIKEITCELSQHGQISETNVYNWFQNRRARSKRKLQNPSPNNAESEVETEVESMSPKEEKANPDIFHSQQNQASRSDELCFQNPEIISGMQFIDPQATKVESMFPSDDVLRHGTRNLGQMPFYDGILSASGDGHINGKMEIPGDYHLYQHPEDYGMTGIRAVKAVVPRNYPNNLHLQKQIGFHESSLQGFSYAWEVRESHGLYT